MKNIKKIILKINLAFILLISSNSLFSAIEMEIPFKNQDLDFSGTLTLPDTLNKYPLIILITGSGPQTRDEEVFGFKVFKVLSDSLVSHGFAVYRYDDRGTGKSKGSFAKGTTMDFAEDANCALNQLYNHRFINSSKVGLLGHSEGGLMAPIVYSKSPDKVQFVILMAGTTLNGEMILRAQMQEILKAENSPKVEADLQIEAQDLMLKYATNKMDKDTALSYMMIIGEKQIAMMPDSVKKSIKDPKKYLTSTLKNQLKSLDGPWMKEFLTLEPKPYLSKLKCPALAVFGEKDVQVPAEMNKTALDKILSENKDLNIKSVIIKDANHLFQKAKSGGISEYSTLDKNFTEDYISTIIDWYKKEIK
jgi:dipeptidyl aminopeptidase/acylaminoacyl peptidase